jgi:hypothetical protein
MSGDDPKKSPADLLGPLARACRAMPAGAVDTFGTVLWAHHVLGHPVSAQGIAAGSRTPLPLVEKNLVLLLAAGMVRREGKAWAPSDQILQELLAAARGEQ